MCPSFVSLRVFRVYDLFISFSLSLDCLDDRISRTPGFTLHKHESEKSTRTHITLSLETLREKIYAKWSRKRTMTRVRTDFHGVSLTFFFLSFCLLSNRKDDSYFTNEYCKCFSRFSFSLLLLFHSWSILFSSSHGSSRFVSLCFSILFILGPARFDSLALFYIYIYIFFFKRGIRGWCADDDPYANDPYFFVIDFGCGPTNFRSRRGGLSSNSEAASPL